MYLAIDCEALDAKANAEGAHFYPRQTAVVAPKGRLYFHSAPHADCKTEIFIIKGDDVVVYQEYQGYVFVMYMGGDFEDGWVKESSLRFTGTIGHD